MRALARTGGHAPAMPFHGSLARLVSRLLGTAAGSGRRATRIPDWGKVLDAGSIPYFLITHPMPLIEQSISPRPIPTADIQPPASNQSIARDCAYDIDSSVYSRYNRGNVKADRDDPGTTILDKQGGCGVGDDQARPSRTP